MGTNYYLQEKPPCECCGRPYEDLHIGKSGGGWCFSLHVDVERGIRDLPDWVERWSAPGVTIKDEYGQQISADEMYRVITERRSWNPSREWDAQELARNHAEPGPYGLLRHQVGTFCLAHGEGTWDLIPGEFC